MRSCSCVGLEFGDLEAGAAATLLKFVVAGAKVAPLSVTAVEGSLAGRSGNTSCGNSTLYRAATPSLSSLL